MKLSVAIASENATANAFVVFRGIESSMKKASALGYDGVELALKEPSEISAVSTGQVFAARHLSFTDEDSENRKELEKSFHEFIDLASDYSRLVNVGRVRGGINGRGEKRCKQLFFDLMGPVADYAEKRGVEILLEPVNRYEIDFINSCEDGVRLIEESGIRNLKLMPDVFHMNIEDASIGDALIKSAPYVRYVHLADSNRHAPGDGHTDFDEIFDALDKIGYDGWVAAELLPFPDPDTAASRAVKYLRRYINRGRADAAFSKARNCNESMDYRGIN